MSRHGPLAARRRVIGSLKCIEFDAPSEAPVIVLFHGYGANGADLAPLAAEMALKSAARWLFPDAPVRLDFGGLAWFEINVAAIEQAQRTGRPVDWSDVEPPGFVEARRSAGAFLQALDAPLDRVVLGGFSQGAMLAVDCALRAETTPRGLAILSGNLILQPQWRAWAPARRGLRFFQSHGIADPILGYPGALALEALLTSAGLEGSLTSFEGGHAIPPEVIEALSRFLDSL